MALAIIAATMLVSTVIVEALELIDDAEAKKGEKTKKAKKHGHGSPGSGGGGHGSPGGGSNSDP